MLPKALFAGGRLIAGSAMRLEAEALCSFMVRRPPRWRKPSKDSGATGLARDARQVFKGGEEREGEHRPRLRDERQIGASWLDRHAASPVTRRPAPSRVVSRARITGKPRPAYSRGVFYSAGHPTGAGACDPGARRRTLLTTKIESARWRGALASLQLGKLWMEWDFGLISARIRKVWNEKPF